MRIAADIPVDDRTFGRLLEGFVRVSTTQWLAHPEWPGLYESGVVYRKEPKGRERWQLVEETMRRKLGDCEDLAIARAAELRARYGEAAHAETYRSAPGVSHAIVIRADGTREDPSKILVAKERKGRMARTQIRRLGEAAPPSASVKTRDNPDGSGTQQALFRFVTSDGHQVSVVAEGANKGQAIARVAKVAARVVTDPRLQAIMPPQAVAAIKATQTVVALAKNKQLRAVAGKLKGPAKKLARMFL